MTMARKLTDCEKNNFRDAHVSDELPREQFKRTDNPREVPDETLVAILLRTGTHGCDVKELAHRLIGAFGSLRVLVSSDWRSILARVKEYNKANPGSRLTGFGEVKCLELAAAFELGRRRQRLSPRAISVKDGLMMLMPLMLYLGPALLSMTNRRMCLYWR